jgi:Cu/Ag efflux protein CusF
MRAWKVVVLVDLALVVGFGGGYLWWAREVRSLRQNLARAAEAGNRAEGDGAWTTDGIVRATLPQLQAAVITHGRIPGLMSGMTMGFQAEEPALLAGLAPGDRVRFTVRRDGPRLLLVRIEKEG